MAVSFWNPPDGVYGSLAGKMANYNGVRTGRFLSMCADCDKTYGNETRLFKKVVYQPIKQRRQSIKEILFKEGGEK